MACSSVVGGGVYKFFFFQKKSVYFAINLLK